MNTQEKMNEVIRIANEEFDGHFTLMKFTTNWRITYGTIYDREDIQTSIEAKTLDEALDKAINSRNSVYDGLRMSDALKLIGRFPENKEWKMFLTN